ncbi:MAG: type II toxin-antitoxin system VapC family toxin [Chloroflexi bacterium]|nr:type II toxin-antitoxin system VapC family toxin [Chloroflexota bacterium]
MPPGVDSVYFDAGVFIAWFNNEPGRADTIERVLTASSSGTLRAITSIVSLAEVVYLRQTHSRLSPEELDRRINSLLLNERLIGLVQLDETVALRARQFVRVASNDRERLTVLDAIHLASAVHAEARYFATYDGDFTRVSENVDIAMGPPTLQISQ